MKNTILSVLITNFNHARFLQSRLSSLLSSMPPDSELIIVDDASTDESATIINEFASRDVRVKFHKNRTNLGINKSISSLLPHAKGKYLAFFAVDDFTFPGLFSKSVAALEQYPSFGLCCSIPAIVADAAVNPTIPSTKPLIPHVKEILPIPTSSVVDIFKTSNLWIAAVAAIIRKDLFYKYKGFDERLGPYSDWMLWHTIALKEGVIYIPEVLSGIRVSPTSYSTLSKKTPIYIQRLLDKINTEYKDIKPSFRQSTILRIQLKSYLSWMAFHPKYWDYLFPIIPRYLFARYKNLFTLCTKILCGSTEKH